MSNSMQSIFIFRLFWTLLSLSLFLIQGINGRKPSFERGQPFLHDPPLKRENDPDPACIETPDSGSGQQLLHVWYFNVEVAQCRELLFRGNDGSPNMFTTRPECERRCLRHYTEGAQQFGPKIKATVEHLVHKSNSRQKFFAQRSVQRDYDLKQKKGRNVRPKKMSKDHSGKEYVNGRFRTEGKAAKHSKSPSTYVHQSDDRQVSLDNE